MDRLRRLLGLSRPAAAPAVDPAAAAEAAEAATRWAYVRVVANVVLWPLQLVASDANALTGTGQGIGGAYAAGGPLATLVQPAGWAFGIWGLIYVATLACVIWQALPAQLHNPLAARTGWYAALAWLLLACWGALASAAPVPDEVGVQLALLVLISLLLRASWLLVRCVVTYSVAFTPAELWCCAAPFSLLAGWVTLATCLNAAVVALLLGAPLSATAGSGSVALAAVCVAALGALGCFLAFATRANPFYIFSYSWGLAGIANAGASGGYGALAGVAGVACAAVLLALFAALATAPGTPPKWGALQTGAAALTQRVGACGADCCRTCGSCGSCCCAPVPAEDTALLGSAATPKRRPRRLLARLWRALGYAEEEGALLSA